MSAGKTDATKLHWMLATVGLLAVLGFLVGVATDQWLLRILTKPLPVLCLVVFVARQPVDAYRNAILAGLVACVAGDVLLEWNDQLFTAGLVAFLIGHLFYIYSFTRDEKRVHWFALLPFVVWVGGLLRWLWPSLGDMQIPVTLYSCVIGVMMWRALAMRIGLGFPAVVPSGWASGALLGAVLFGTSDSLIAISRFQMDIEYVRYAIILLYWAGQFGIAVSVRRRRHALSV
jgi:uncharacterized membrane protein YhhN